MKIYVVLYQFQYRKDSHASIIGSFTTLKNAIKIRDKKFEEDLKNAGGSDDGWIIESGDYEKEKNKYNWIQYHNGNEYNIYEVHTLELQE